MADYNPDEAFDKQKQILERVRRVHDTLRTEVLDYYADSYPENPDLNYRNEDGIRRYLKGAYQDIGDILTELERAEGI